jgi:hypothetical protein
VEVGQRTEGAILAELVRRGYKVLLPFGVNQRYDLVLEIGGRFVRAQCKTGRLRNGVVRFKTCSVRSNRRETATRGYEGEVEVFLVYCWENECAYCVPADDANGFECWLRIEPCANSQSRRIRWARDHDLARLAQLARARDL